VWDRTSTTHLKIRLSGHERNDGTERMRTYDGTGLERELCRVGVDGGVRVLFLLNLGVSRL
jgi:hypothetical protein